MSRICNIQQALGIIIGSTFLLGGKAKIYIKKEGLKSLNFQAVHQLENLLKNILSELVFFFSKIQYQA